MAEYQSDRVRIYLHVCVRMAVSALPWRLLTGAERGPRDRQETARRLDLATEKIVAAIEAGNVDLGFKAVTGGEACHGPPGIQCMTPSTASVVQTDDTTPPIDL